MKRDKKTGELLSRTGKYRYNLCNDARDKSYIAVMDILHKLGIEKFKDQEQKEFYNELKYLISSNSNVAINKDNVDVKQLLKTIRRWCYGKTKW